MAFTYDITTDVGRVRLHLRDHDEARAMFDDAEIGHLLTTAGSWQRAVAEGAKVLLAERARFANSEGVGEVGTPEREPGIDPAFAEYLRDLVTLYGGGSTVLPKVTVTHFGAHPSDPTTC